MTRYFIAAQIWLVFAVVVVLGRTNSSVPASSFLHGPLIADYIYNLIVLGLFAISAFFFTLTWKTRK